MHQPEGSFALTTSPATDSILAGVSVSSDEPPLFPQAENDRTSTKHKTTDIAFFTTNKTSFLEKSADKAWLRLFQTISLSLNGSPHCGQNLGVC